MSGLLASGRIVDLILALTVLEAAAIIWLHRRTGRGIAAKDLLGTLLSGMCLLLALRCALTGAGWVWIPVCLLGSLVAHVADLRRRWRGGTR